MSVFIFYTNSVKIDLKTFCKTKIKISYIQVAFDHINNITTIIYLFSYVPGKGVGSSLIYYACKKSLEQNISKIELDDCSDHFRKKNNIYLKLGFRYISNFGPEMVGDVKEILNKYQSTLSKSVRSKSVRSKSGGSGSVPIFSCKII